MEYIRLHNGVNMPKLGLGTWNLRGKECEEVIKVALECGYRLIDTAHMYDNEKEIGNVLGKTDIPRSDLFICTKMHSSFNSYDKAKIAIEESLKNLQVDYIDLYLIHEVYSHAKDMYKALEEAYVEGKVKAIGVSNFKKDYFESFVKDVKIIPMVNQMETHVYFQQIDLHHTLDKYHTVLEAWAPFTSGEKNLFNDPVLIEIGQKYHKSAAQIALRFMIQNDIVVIPKSKHKERLMENINIFDFVLVESDIKKIKQLDMNQQLYHWY